MSDTVKLIIEMPKEVYEQIVEAGDLDYLEVITAIENGIPLDDVKAKIANIDSYSPYRDGCWVMADVWNILDNIGKTESEE